MQQHDTTDHPTSLTDDARETLLHALTRDYSAYRVWWAGDIWYATGPCSDPSCSCMRTLHAPTPDGLRRQLAAATKARAAALSATESTQPGLRLVTPVLDVEATMDRVVETVRRIQREGRRP